MQLKNKSMFLPELDKANTVLISATNNDNGSTPIPHEVLDYSFETVELKNDQGLLVCKSCCRIIEAAPNTLTNTNQLRWTEARKPLLCRNCLVNLANDEANVSKVENELHISKASDENTINKKKDKHYCDKCRFASKDLEQYKKHVSQHEAIQFICSYCSCVSYTKGEFQRHLVKHTGTFPYKCDYCEYGAVRNDYVVKHTRRVHGTAIEKYPTVVLEKQEQSKIPAVTLNDEEVEGKPGSQNHLSNLTSDMSCESPFETWTYVSLCYIECDEPVISPKDNLEVEVHEDAPCCDSVNISACQDDSVEVEMLSSESTSLQLGLPLTVVAPPQLIVPPNSFAELMEIKMVNGIEMLVLRLFQKNETYSECLIDNAEESKNSSGNPNQLLAEVSFNQTKPLLTNNAHGENSNVNSDGAKSKPNWLKKTIDCSSDHEADLLSLPTHDTCNEKGALTKDSRHKNSDASKLFLAESDVQENSAYQSKDVLLSESLFTADEQKEMNCSEKSLNVSICSFSDAAFSQCDQTGMPHGTNSSSLTSGNLPLSAEIFENDKSIDQFDRQSFSAISDSSFNRNALPFKDCNNYSNPRTDPQRFPKTNSFIGEPQNLDFVNNVTEGPFILSVFSLSSGIENIPEGINWGADVLSNSESSSLTQSVISPTVTDQEDLKSPFTILGDKLPASLSNSDPAEVLGIKCSVDKIAETVYMDISSDHLQNHAHFSQTKMETSSETVCNSARTQYCARKHVPCSSTDEMHNMPSLKENGVHDDFCKKSSSSNTDIPIDKCIFPKNENVADPMEMSQESTAQASDCKMDVACCVNKTEQSHCMTKDVSCLVENDCSPSNRHLNMFIFPTKNEFKEDFSENSHVSKSVGLNHNANETQNRISLPDELKTSVLKHEKVINDAHKNVSQEQPKSSNNIAPGKELCPNNRKRKKTTPKPGSVCESIPNSCPVFIPKGTVLTVFDSCGIGKSKRSDNCSKYTTRTETFLPLPVLFYRTVETQSKRPLLDKASLERPTCRSNLEQNTNPDSESKLQRSLDKQKSLLLKKRSTCGKSPKQDRHPKKQSKPSIKKSVEKTKKLSPLDRKSTCRNLKQGPTPKKASKSNRRSYVKQKKQETFGRFNCNRNKQGRNSQNESKPNIAGSLKKQGKCAFLDKESFERSTSKRSLNPKRNPEHEAKSNVRKSAEKQKKQPLLNKDPFERCAQSGNRKKEPKPVSESKAHTRRNTVLVNLNKDELKLQKAMLKRPLSTKMTTKETSSKKFCPNKKIEVRVEINRKKENTSIAQERHLKLFPVLNDQLITCPRRNQPVVVMNHPDVESVEIVNIMKTINTHKGRVLRVFLSQRTMHCLGVKQHYRKLTCKKIETIPFREQLLLKIKQNAIVNPSEQSDAAANEIQQNRFKDWFCGSEYEDQDDWRKHGQNELFKSSRDLECVMPMVVSHS
ncbi:zinc finger protein 518B [Ambystoma mexicanum]|uniref:zinc finger protein 518B n=1 Tax=Ambystoma mexicanum TaxID=8296 RepID=UPI0037E90D16